MFLQNLLHYPITKNIQMSNKYQVVGHNSKYCNFGQSKTVRFGVKLSKEKVRGDRKEGAVSSL